MEFENTHDYSFLYSTIENIKKDLVIIPDSEDIHKKYEDFKKKYPKLWNAIITNNFDLEQFKTMNSAFKKMYEIKEGDHHDKKLMGDIAVGSILAKKYVYKDGHVPSTEELNKAFTAVKMKNQFNKDNDLLKKKSTLDE